MSYGHAHLLLSGPFCRCGSVANVQPDHGEPMCAKCALAAESQLVENSS